MSRIIISDVHGCYKTLLALIAQLPKEIPITFAGDLIDRGPDSSSVVSFVKDGKYDCTQGNHEVMMYKDLSFRSKKDGTEHYHVNYYSGDWLVNGGERALSSYIIKGEHNISLMKEHISWMKSLPYFIHYKDLTNDKGESLLVSHSTAAHVWDLDHESFAFISGITWDRDSFPPKIDGIYNVYGHTPQKNGPTVKDHFSCIDTGVYLKTVEEYGRLTALQFPEMIVYTQNNIEYS